MNPFFAAAAAVPVYTRPLASTQGPDPAAAGENAYARLTRIPGVWRGIDATPTAVVPTGAAALDEKLGGGWPLGALSQLIGAVPGLGLNLLLPMLAQLSAARRPVVLIAPPYIPYAPALAAAGIELGQLLWLQPETPQAALWACEQALRCTAVGAAVLWSEPLDLTSERRLQLAAESGGNLAISCHTAAAGAHSIAALRLQLSLHMTRSGTGLQVEIARCRGRRAGATVQLPADWAQAA